MRCEGVSVVAVRGGEVKKVGVVVVVGRVVVVVIVEVLWVVVEKVGLEEVVVVVYVHVHA